MVQSPAIQGDGEFKTMNRNFFALLLIGLLCSGANARAADDPDFITFGAAAYDWVNVEDIQVEYRLEYRGRKLLGPVKPVVALAGTYCLGRVFKFCPGKGNTGSGFIGGGGLIDLFFGRRIVASPSLTVHYYTGGTDDLDLQSPVIFRFQVELAYRFDNRSRLGFAVSRYDNLGLGDRNPGTESATLYYSIPLDGLFEE